MLEDRHALYVGWVLGLAIRNGLPATPVVDAAGDYTDRIALELELGGRPLEVAVVVPSPPPDWSLEAR